MDIYEQAYDTIVKIAEEEGVDLDSLSDEQVQELIEELVEEQAERNEGGEEVKEAHLTYADVAHELAKIAHVNGIDITQVSAEEYNAAFDKLASDMSDPSYWETQQKIAEADYIGRVMAQSFYDESQKIAAGRISGAFGRAKDLIKGDTLKSMANTRSGAVAQGRISRGARRALKDGADPELVAANRAALKDVSSEAKKVMAARAALGLGGLGVAGGTAAALRGRGGDEEKVAALDDFVTQRTVEILAEAGLI